MVEKKENDVNKDLEESNIDLINNVVTNSNEATEDKEEFHELEEDSKDNSQSATEEKPQEKTAPQNKLLQKPKKVVEKTVQLKKVETKKPVIKTVKKEERIEKPVRKIVKPVAKPEVKKMVKKSKPKTVSKKEYTKKTSKKNSNNQLWTWIAVGIIAIILAFAIYMLVKPKNENQTEINQTTNKVAVTVNGDPIYLNDLTEEFNRLAPSAQGLYSIDTILNKSIDELLLVQKAKSLGIKVSSDEIDYEIENIKKQNGLTQEQLESALTMQNLDLEKLKTVIERNLFIRKLLNDTILKNIEITDSQIESFYNLNSDKFKAADKVTVQHILLSVEPNQTVEEVRLKAQELASTITVNNFCDLVTEYSSDKGSLETCGKYTFAKGDFNNPDFENPSFELGVNQTTIAKTIFGWHIIRKIENIPGEVPELSLLKPTIQKILYDETAQKNYVELILELRKTAVIVNYMNAKSQENTQVLIPLEEATKSNLDDFAKCLSDTGAKFYGAYWCPHCNNQKELFGSSIQYVTYIECADESNPQVQTAACSQAEISGYPTWIVGGKQYPGEQTLEKLSELTGCTLEG